jgi:hypothetical protein
VDARDDLTTSSNPSRNAGQHDRNRAEVRWRRKPLKSNATKLAHKKFRWFEQLAADTRMPLLALRACIVIGSKCSLDGGGVAIIGQDKIAEKLGVWRQAANQALRQAIALGHLEAIQRGRNKPNGYRMVLKDEAAETAGADVRDSRTTGRNESRTSSSNESRTSVVRESRTDSPFFSPGAPTEPPGEGERDDALARINSSPGGDPAADAAPRRADSPAAAPPSRRESPIERSRSVAREERFGELREIWRRPWPDDDAADLRAFEAACREVTPDEIIEAAAAWVAAADAPRFLPPLSKWLANRGWEKPPPMKARRSHGNGRRHNGDGRGPVANVFFEIAGYEQDADGNWMGGAQ